MYHTKEQDETPEELSDIETGNLPEKDFRVMTAKTIKEHRRKMDAQR